MPTIHTQLEPMQGFGKNPFGEPSTDREWMEVSRGFGDPKTIYTEDNDE